MSTTGGDVLVEALRPGDPEQLDRYRVVGRLGEGGQGTVYLARDAAGTQVAVKVLLPEVVADRVARERIAAEVALARRVPSFCTARLLGARLDGDRPYLVTEYVPGPSLAQAVRRDGPLTGSELERLMVGTLTALVTIHRAGVVHHDLKPENILLGPDGPRVVDFGIALRTGARDPQAGADGVLGSAAFLAPERLDAGPASPASDVFGWAATMVHAATGRSPFQAPTSTGVIRAVEHSPARMDGVPAALRPLLADCLAKEPDRRPAAGVALGRLLESLQPVALPDTYPGPPPGAAVPPSPAVVPGAAAGGAPPWGTPAGGRPTLTSPAQAPGPAAPPRPPAGRPPAARPPARPAARPRRDPRLKYLGVPAMVILAMVRCASGGGDSSPPDVPPWSYPAAPSVASVDWADSVAIVGDGVEVIDSTGGDVVTYPRTQAGADDLTGTSTAGFRSDPADQLHWEVLSADGGRVAAMSLPSQPDAGGAVVHVYDAGSGRLINGADPWTLSGSGDGDVAASRDGSVVAASVRQATVDRPTSPGHVGAWRLDGTILLDLDLPDVREGLVVSPDGGWVAVPVGTAGTAPGVRYRIVRLDGTRSSAYLPVGCLGAVAFDPAGTRVYCQLDRRIEVYRTNGVRTAAVPGTASRPGLLRVSPDGLRIAQTDTAERRVRVFTAHGDVLTDVVLEPADVEAMAFGPASDQLVLTGAGRFWTVAVPAVPPVKSAGAASPSRS